MQGIVLALFGACVGSFTNVVAWRLPRQESVVVPGSHCPRCSYVVRWHENLPILGWLLLLGPCRDCRSPIGVRYPVVEALSAGLWLSAVYVQPSGGGGLSLAALLWAGLPLIALLLPLVVIDFDHMWLPEPLCRWGVLVGLSISTTAGLAVFVDHLIATVLALLALESISALAERLVGKPALGWETPNSRPWEGPGLVSGALPWRWAWRCSLVLSLAAWLGSPDAWLRNNLFRSAHSLPWEFGWCG